MHSSPTKTIKKENPLVLLHMTLLPIPHEYPRSALEHVLPPTILANWQLLMEKMSPTVLHRGVLIPHPREDYDLLEERLLESLELRQTRILKCGHFHLSAEEEADINVYEDEFPEEQTEDEKKLDICPDCGRKIRDGRFGDTGSGSKRWDVKVFAANGLMRAGAWHAAWREMERVDIEILPWMEESMRRELDARAEDEERMKQEEELARKEEGVGGLDDERLKEIYGQELPSLAEVHDETTSIASLQFGNASTPRRPFNLQTTYQRPDIPLSELMRNYCYLLAQDRRNIALLLLSILVVFLSLRLPAQNPTSAPALSVMDTRVSSALSATLRESSSTVSQPTVTEPKISSAIDASSALSQETASAETDVTTTLSETLYKTVIEDSERARATGWLSDSTQEVLE